MIIKSKASISRLLIISLLVFLTACSGDRIETDLAPSEGGTSLQLSAGGAPAPKKAGEVQVESVAPKIEVIEEKSVAVEASIAEVPAEGETSIESPQVISPTAEPAQPPAAEMAQPQIAQVDTSIPAEPRVGYRAPEFILQSLDGQSVQLSEFQGQPFLISYWATWCVPCLNELNILGSIYSEYQQQGLTIVAINAIEQDSIDKVQQTVNETGMTFPVLLDHNDQFAQTYQALFFPTTYYVDATGVIREIILGDTSEVEFRDKIEKLLANEL